MSVSHTPFLCDILERIITRTANTVVQENNVFVTLKVNSDSGVSLYCLFVYRYCNPADIK